jgi:hypothetical protein
MDLLTLTSLKKLSSLSCLVACDLLMCVNQLEVVE